MHPPVGRGALRIAYGRHGRTARTGPGQDRKPARGAARYQRCRAGGGATFSFWRQVGRATTLRGYVPGRELREGCIVPAIGGGICQLSNALYQAAADAGLEIVERHAHSQVIPGSAAAIGRDATVFWNYVDLRFRSDQPCRIEVALERTQLVVRILEAAAAPADILPWNRSAHRLRLL
ncbi:VanW family protein [Massilia sp. H-1]|nr:VanW family protein [Massilia sp. H-1]